MKALVRTGLEPHAFYYESVPIPQIDDNQVLIRVKAVGVCGTDFHMWTGGVKTKIPVIVGHEFSGCVEEKGKNVTNVDVGDKVVSRLNINVCGVCKPCLTGNPHMCVHRQCPGFQIDGAYAEYIAIDAKQLVKLDKNVEYEAGAFAEPFAIVTHALLERTKLEPEDVVVIFGPGPIGLIAEQLSQLYGASKVIVVGTNVDEPMRIPLAKKLGAFRVLNAQTDDVFEEVMKITHGEGVDLVIEASGAQPAINSGIDILRRQGRMCVLGLPTVEKNNIKWLTAAQKSLSVIFNYSSSPIAWNKVVSMLNRGVLDTDSLITHKVTLDRYKELFKAIEEGKVVKGMFLP